MTKVRTLSRYFLSGHPHAGQPTFFVEKFLNSLKIDYRSSAYYYRLLSLNSSSVAQGKLTEDGVRAFWTSLEDEISEEKHHTLRGGSHFKENDFISLRCWSGQPYKGGQIILCEDINVKKVFQIALTKSRWELFIKPVGRSYILEDSFLATISKNDGLSIKDFLAWFGSTFEGQVICWNSRVAY
jgi:hypothetical protein